MKTTKRLLAVLMAAVLLCVGVPFAAQAEGETSYQVGDLIQFGNYPQTRVDETPELKAAVDAAVWASYKYYTGTGSNSDGTELKAAAEAATWKSYGYYSGTYNPREGTGDRYDGKMKPCNSMEFADFFFEGQKYRAVLFHSYRSYNTGYYSFGYDYHYQTKNGYVPRGLYYFKYEPLNWLVLDPTTNMIMCQNVIDSQAYQNTIKSTARGYCQSEGTSVYANDYATSSIRSWLNNDFLNTAFTDIQKENIQFSALNNNAFFNGAQYESYNSLATNDKVFLL